MLSNEELTAIKALDLAPEVEREIISLEEKHRQVLFSKPPGNDERQHYPLAANGADTGDEVNDDINTNSGSQRLLKRKEKLIPWHVQFG